MPHEETELLFTVKTQRGQRGDGLARIVMETINPRAAGGTPGFPPKVPPPPPSRKLVVGYIEEVQQAEDGAQKIRLVLEVEAGENW